MNDGQNGWPTLDGLRRDFREHCKVGEVQPWLRTDSVYQLYLQMLQSEIRRIEASTQSRKTLSAK